MGKRLRGQQVSNLVQTTVRFRSLNIAVFKSLVTIFDLGVDFLSLFQLSRRLYSSEGLFEIKLYENEKWKMDIILNEN